MPPFRRDDETWSRPEDQEAWPKPEPGDPWWGAARVLHEQEWGAGVSLARERFGPPRKAAPEEEREWGAAVGLGRERRRPPPR